MSRGILLAAAVAFMACPSGPKKCTTNADCTLPQVCNVTSGSCENPTITGGGGGALGGGGGSLGGGGGSMGGGTGGGGTTNPNGGETCDMAVEIQPGTLMGTTVGKSNDYDPGCTGGPTPGPDSVYKISVPAGQRLTVTATPEMVTTGDQYDLAVYIVPTPASNCISTDTDGGTSLECLGAADDAQDIAAVETASYLNTGSAAREVFVFVDSYWAMTRSNPDGGVGAANAGNFTLQTTIAAPAGGDTCATAIMLTPGTPLTNQSLAMYGDDYSGSATCEGSSSADVAYQVTVPDGQVLTVTVTPSMTFDPVLSVSETADACDVTCLAGIDVGGDGGGERYQYRNTTGAPKTLFLVVDGYAGSTGTFEISATVATPPADDVCSAPTQLTVGTPLTAQAIAGYTNDYTSGTGCSSATGADRVYSVSVPAGQRLTVTVTPTTQANPSISLVADAASCGTTCVASANSTGVGAVETLSYTNRTASAATWLVVVDFTAASAGTFDIVANVATPPADDVCEMATALTAGAAPIAGTTVGYTNDYQNGTGTTGCATTGALDADRVYSVTVPNGQRASVTVTPSTPDAGFNPSLNLVDGPAATCSAMPRVCAAGSNAAGANAPETVSIFNASGAAKTYFAIVDSTTAPGAFTIGYTTAAPAADDTCTTATTALTPGQTVTANLTGFTADYPGGTNCFAASGPDRVYTVQLAADQKLAMTVTPVGADGGFDPVVNFIPGPASACEASPRTCQGGIDFTARNAAESGAFTNNSGAAMTLYVLVADYETNSTVRDFTIQTTVAAAPAGESCRVPLALTPGMLAGQTLAGASADVFYGTASSMTCAPSNGAPDRVYSISVPAGQTLTVALTPATAADFSLNIIDGPATVCGDVMACLDSADALGSSVNPETASWQNTTGAAKTVFVHATANNTAALTANYSLNVTLQ